MERSFAREVTKLTLGEGEVFHGEAILAVTKALLQAGVAYIGGYPGAPVSHLMDVLTEAREKILEPQGIYFEQSASEAGAAALLGASIHYPLRGAVTWKSIVGTNVASDALSNLASAGVRGGALVIVGEDYGEGASVIQERTHATALKSSIPLIDPRCDVPTIVRLTEKAFDLSEASRLPVMLQLRIRSAHMTGSFVCTDNRPPPFGSKNPVPVAKFDYGRIALPPSTYEQEIAKVEERLPAARRFILEHKLNEHHPGDGRSIGIIMQGGVHGTVLRGLRLLGAADVFGRTPVPLLVLNLVYPLVPEQIIEFLRTKDSVLIVEEGNPPLIEHEIRSIAQQAGINCRIRGKDLLVEAGEYVAEPVRNGLAAFLADADAHGLGPEAQRRILQIEETRTAPGKKRIKSVPARPPGFCTGCPERPVFTALKLIGRERGPIHVSADIGCSSFAALPPFAVGSTILGYGMSLASAGAVGPALNAPSVAVMGDGAFWHNGMATGAVNALWNDQDAVLVILDNGYASATGQQHLPSSAANLRGRRIRLSIEAALRSFGVRWIRRVNAYQLRRTLSTLRQALDARGSGLRVVISDQECMLALQRRQQPVRKAAEQRGQTVVRARYGVDEEVCVGDHSCIRLSGCPSLTLRPARDPLKDAPTAHVDEACVACGLCGEVALAASLCPSFYEASYIVNPNLWQRMRQYLKSWLLARMGVE
jgi:indolepyruvate ferredoxin oxidoreductase alpha subunit